MLSILITCLKSSRNSFCLSCYRGKMHWGRGSGFTCRTIYRRPQNFTLGRPTWLGDILRTLAWDVPKCYIEDHMGTFLRHLFGTSWGRPRDVILPSGKLLCKIPTSLYQKICDRDILLVKLQAYNIFLRIL